MKKLFLIPILCLTCVACDNQRHDKTTKNVKAREIADMSSDTMSSPKTMSSDSTTKTSYPQSKYSDSSQTNPSYSESKYSDYSQPKPYSSESKYSDYYSQPKPYSSESKYYNSYSKPVQDGYQNKYSESYSQPMRYAQPSRDMKIEVYSDSAMGSATEMDRMIMQKIRDMLMKDDVLSSKAKNIQVIVLNGSVTVRGPVATPKEKERILAKIKEMREVKKVDDQLSSAS